MTEFKNVTVQKKSNIYFDGKVISTKIIFEDGSIKTLGVMQPGDYEFDTKDKEVMDILSGELEVRIQGALVWQKINTGKSFEVPASSKFKMKVLRITNYCCSYIK
tara:strand:- start:1170 stop:1484 length:315 start_codon:yes stop_codon:yes gene_type:complete